MAALKHILICGMGGSGLPGYALDSYALVEHLPIRVLVWNSYGLPASIMRNTPVFCISYSGNTEETISNFREAKRRGYPIHVITSGGTLAALSRRARVPISAIPPGAPPRNAIGYLTGALLEALMDLRIIRRKRSILETCRRFDPTQRIQEGVVIGKKLATSIPLVYTSRTWYAIGHIWKIAFNETAKIPAFAYTIPEANHNDMEGFAEKPVAARKNFHALFIGFSGDDPRIKKRMALSRTVWAKAGIPTRGIELQEGEFWQTFFRAVGIGYSAARTVARARKVDPNATRTIEQFKTWMAK